MIKSILGFAIIVTTTLFLSVFFVQIIPLEKLNYRLRNAIYTVIIITVTTLVGISAWNGFVIDEMNKPYKEKVYDSISNIKEVDSSAIDHIGYSKKYNALLIGFVDSGEYIYYEVPIKEYRQLKRAGSKGKYFNSNIKGAYDYEIVRSYWISK